jgi:RNA polymerase sigma-70 factor (ECF subfamily)
MQHSFEVSGGQGGVLDEVTAPLSPASDAELVAMIREQPTAGLAALYDRYGRLIFSVALRVVQDHGTAEEITQDVFLRCWRNIDRYQPSQGSLPSWLLAITHHRAIDELRSRRGKDMRREVSDDGLPPLVALDSGFDEALLRGEVHEALHLLPRGRRPAATTARNRSHPLAARHGEAAHGTGAICQQ